eukprot:TRINITY_DN72103_c0_g1_i1.p1 TRINITY_DN72103_c0_g1~~TRINITY_DN72103_c0_g1_i1.p1  ORF type:complete len:755 (+),score=201.45 TRINITY_DN72103_c0_g1_i1:106-2370(+)
MEVGHGAATRAARVAREPSPSPVQASSFPPLVNEAEEVLATQPSHDEEDRARATWQGPAILRRWCDALRELLEELQRGTPADAPPVEEVYHWLAGSERLARSQSFAEHATVVEMVAVVEAAGAEGKEAADRWSLSVRRLRQTVKECDWNSRYLQVVEQPLLQLADPNVVRQGALTQVVSTLLRSLNRIYCTSSYYREPRMAPLLHKILKIMVSHAGEHLTPPHSIARPPGGFGEALRLARELQDGFQAFQDHFFVSEATGTGTSSSSTASAATASTSALGGAGAERRPATAMGSKGDRLFGGAMTNKRKDAVGDLGWWRAQVRTSLEHAEHCRALSARVAALLANCAGLLERRRDLQHANADLHRRVQSFVELHSSMQSLDNMAELLDLKRRANAYASVLEVAERLQGLILEAEALGVKISYSGGIVSCGGDAPSLVASASGFAAEVLRFEGEGGADAPGLDVREEERPATSGELQEDIESLREELRSFGSQLENLSSAITRTAAAAVNHRPIFAPPPRTGSGRPTSSCGYPAAANSSAAKEVARRATWYKAPPAIVPEDVPLLDVSCQISTTTVLRRCPSRPRTSHPKLFVTRSPSEAARPFTTACLLQSREAPARASTSAGEATVEERGRVSSCDDGDNVSAASSTGAVAEEEHVQVEEAADAAYEAKAQEVFAAFAQKQAAAAEAESAAASQDAAEEDKQSEKGGEADEIVEGRPVDVLAASGDDADEAAGESDGDGPFASVACAAAWRVV